MMKKGILISFEGGEGSGKSEQVKRLAKYLRRLDKKVIITREPGGTKISEQIRKIILDKKNIRMAYETETLLFQAARAQVCEQIILPALKKGKIVLADRFRDSSTVYQGMVRGLGVKYVKLLNDVSTKKTLPRITFLLDVPAEVGLRRRNKTDKNDRLDGENTPFHRKIRAAYLKWAKKNLKRFVIIDGTQSREAIHQEILEILRKKKII
jgi:dTMP kinase